MRKIIIKTLTMVDSILTLLSVISYSFVTSEFRKLASDDPFVWQQDIEAFQKKDLESPPPAEAVLFAGTNDITGRENDKSVQQIADDFIKLAGIIADALPETVLYYLPITPTISRWDIWSKVDKVNQFICEYASGNEKVYFIEATPYFIDEEGNPREELLSWDGTHLNKAGYAI